MSFIEQRRENESRPQRIEDLGLDCCREDESLADICAKLNVTVRDIEDALGLPPWERGEA